MVTTGPARAGNPQPHFSFPKPACLSIMGVGLDGRPGHSQSFFESMDGLGQTEVGHCGVFLLHSSSYAQKRQVHNFILLMLYDPANHVSCVY